MDTLEDLLHRAAEKAAVELNQASLESVQLQTAITWAGRALYCFTRFEATRDIQFLLMAEEFAHEAVEHGALACRPGFSDAIAAYMQAAKDRVLQK